MIAPGEVIAVGVLLFAFGLATICVHRNAVRILMGIELMLTAANLNFVAFGRLWADATAAAVTAVSVMAGAAAEAAVALALVYAVVARVETPDAERMDLLRR